MGGVDVDFYSGGGSYYDELIVPYCKEISKFIEEHDIRTVIDFGCGDFNVASRFVSDKIDYIGVDIVPELIKRNREKYAAEHVSFLLMDIVETEAPDAELCLVREVFQHLSNEEIQRALKNMQKYRYIIVTESVIKKELLGGNYNLDKAHGNSFGVYLEEAPFLQKTQRLLQIPYPGLVDQEMITSLIINE